LACGPGEKMKPCPVTTLALRVSFPLGSPVQARFRAIWDDDPGVEDLCALQTELERLAVEEAGCEEEGMLLLEMADMLERAIILGS